MTTTPRPLSAAEQQQRLQAVNAARASVRLEGLILDPVVEELNLKYVQGELSSDALTSALLRHYQLRD